MNIAKSVVVNTGGRDSARDWLIQARLAPRDGILSGSTANQGCIATLVRGIANISSKGKKKENKNNNDDINKEETVHN